MSRPPLPPRRSVPIPPKSPESSIDVPAPTGIAARIASLQLDQIGRSPLSRPPSTKSTKDFAQPPPPPPRRNVVPPPPPRGSRTPSQDYQEEEEEVRPPPPPRRSVVPPLPARGSRTPSQDYQEEEEEEEEEAAPPPPPRRRSVVPPLPARGSRTPSQDYQEEEQEEEEEEEEEEEVRPPPPPPRRSLVPPLPPRDLAKALSRPPPPPPTRAASAPAVPVRRLPPRLPTPPPEPEPEPEYEDPEEYEQSDEGYQSQDESCIKCHDFSHIDAHAVLFPRQSVVSIEQLAHDLTDPFPSETEKARAIFTWQHHNISYDAESFLAGNIQPSTAMSTLRSGLAVCDGYAGMFLALAEIAGLQVHKVTGHGKGVGYAALAPGERVPPESSNHAWNCVLMDGEWRLLDACWGAGVLNGSAYDKRFAPVWFTSTPAEFGKRHFPTDRSYQLIADEDGGPVSWEEYISAPEGPVVFLDFYKLDFLIDLLQPAGKEIQSGQWASFHIFKQCEHMSRDEASNYVFFINTPDDTRTPLEPNAEGGWSANIYMPRGKGDVSLYYVTQVDGRDALGLTVQGFKKANGRKAMAFGGMARWSLI